MTRIVTGYTDEFDRATRRVWQVIDLLDLTENQKTDVRDAFVDMAMRNTPDRMAATFLYHAVAAVLSPPHVLEMTNTMFAQVAGKGA